MIVSKKALASSKRNGLSDSLTKSLAKNNPKAFAGRPDQNVSGIEKPLEFLKQLKENVKESKHRGSNELNTFKREFERIQRTNILSTEEERISFNFKAIMDKSLNSTERKDLREFMGWKGGHKLNENGFEWNREEKRFEKKVMIEGVEFTKYIYINHLRGKDKYSAGVIEYGIE